MPLPPELLWIRPLSQHFPHSCNSCAIVESDGRWTWIDPGAAGEDNLGQIQNELGRHDLSLDRLIRVIVTHAHPDHLAAAGALFERGCNAPIHCHPDAAASARDVEALIATFDFNLALTRFPDHRNRVERYIERSVQFIFRGPAPFVATDPVTDLTEGTVLECGPFSLECLETPGHAPGHVSLFDRASGLLIAGDVVGRSLAWHSPSSGGAQQYLDSVERLSALDVSCLLPSHGEPTDEPDELLSKMRKRLLDREQKLIDSIAAGPIPYGQLYDRITNDPHRTRLFPYVPMIEGHLQRLARAGEIVETDHVVARL